MPMHIAILAAMEIFHFKSSYLTSHISNQAQIWRIVEGPHVLIPYQVSVLCNVYFCHKIHFFMRASGEKNLKKIYKYMSPRNNT